jgi:hypothetical protein
LNDDQDSDDDENDAPEFHDSLRVRK